MQETTGLESIGRSSEGEVSEGTVLVLVLPMCVSNLRCQWSLLVFSTTIYK